MLNPVHLQTLAAVLRFGSFADAARQLGYTGSAVSQQMSALERQLRITLFEREAQSIRATPAAEEIAAHSAGVLGALRGLEDVIERLASGTVGRFRIGSFPTAGEHLLPAALAHLRWERPGLDVHLDEEEPVTLVPMLERREVDVALLYQYPGVATRWPTSLEIRAVLTEDLLLVRRRGSGAEESDTAPADLAAHREDTWIASREDTWGAAALGQLCRAAGFEPRVRCRSNNYSLIQSLVGSGLGTALVPAMAYRPAAGLAASPVGGSLATRQVLVASAPSTPAPLVDAFAGAVTEAARRLARERPGLCVADQEGVETRTRQLHLQVDRARGGPPG